MQRGLIYSIALHVGVVLLLIVSAVRFHRALPPEPQVIVVDAVPVSALTNIKVAPKRASVEKEKPKETSTKTPPKVAQPEPQPVPEKEPEPKPEPKQKPDNSKEKIPDKNEKPKKEKPQTKPKPKPKEVPKKKEEVANEFGSVLKSVEAMEDKKNEPDSKQNEFDSVEEFVAQHADTSFNPELPLSVDEKQAVFQQIYKHWVVQPGMRNAESMLIQLSVELLPDGTVQDVKVLDTGRYNSDPMFNAAARTAVQAVFKSSPLKGLPAEKYDIKDGWKTMEITFDPSSMFY